MNKTILVTRRIPEPGLSLLQAAHNVVLNAHDKPMPREELLAALKEADAALTQLVDRVDRDFFAAAPRLKVVANYAVGYDNIDLAAARERNVVVTNTPGVLTEATAELAWTLLFTAARRAAEADALTRRGGFTGWAPEFMLGQGVACKTLGIVGAGRIGTAFGLMSKGFKMKVLYVSRKRNEELEREVGAEKADLERVLREADYISLHTSLAPETRRLIGREQLKKMKPSAVLVNTARGAVIDEEALVEALKEKRIFAAGLDVYDKEPALAAGLADLANAVLLPHIGSATFETRARMAELAAKNILAVLAGRPPLTPVS